MQPKAMLALGMAIGPHQHHCITTSVCAGQSGELLLYPRIMLNDDHSDALIFDQAPLMQLPARCTTCIVGPSLHHDSNMLQNKWGIKAVALQRQPRVL